MALTDTILRAKDKISSAVSNFFYPKDEYPRDDRTVTRRDRRAGKGRDAGYDPRREEYDAYGAPADGSAQGGGWTEPRVSESSPYQNTNPYQAAPEQGRAPQGAYSQGQYAPQGGYQQPQGGFQQSQAAPRQGAYQQPQGGYQQPPQDQAASQDANILFFPNASQQARETAVRVITARGVSDCYSAITQLRLGDMVILVMEGITDPAEMRHYVDMLSGACYSLRATITKLSRHGAYLICPANIRVYVDAATNQLNSGARQPHRPMQPFSQARYAQGAAGYNPSYAGDPSRAPAGFDMGARQQGAPDAYAAGGDKGYYGRSAMPEAQGTADRLQPYADGYMPDSPMDAVGVQ